MKPDSNTLNVDNLSRRNMLIGAAGAAAAATSLLASNAFAASHSGTEMKHGGMHHKGHSMANTDLIDVSNTCIKHGDLCIDHCIELVKGGDTSIASCLSTVSEMLASCAALSKLAAYQSPHLSAIAKVCIAVCEDCEKECRKHADTHAECKQCADSCKECIAACKKVLA